MSSVFTATANRWPCPPHHRSCGYATCAENNKKSSPSRGRGSTGRALGRRLRAGRRVRRPGCRTRPSTPTTREPRGTPPRCRRPNGADPEEGSCLGSPPSTTEPRRGTPGRATCSSTGQSSFPCVCLFCVSAWVSKNGRMDEFYAAILPARKAFTNGRHSTKLWACGSFLFFVVIVWILVNCSPRYNWISKGKWILQSL